MPAAHGRVKVAKRARDTTLTGQAAVQHDIGARPLAPGSPQQVLALQRTVGNQATMQLLNRQVAAPAPLQRSFTKMPVAYVGNNAQTAPGLLKKYVGTETVANGLTFGQEIDRVKGALAKIQPSKATEVAEKIKNTGMKLSDPAEAINNAAKLEIFVGYVNALIATYQLDAAAVNVSARVDDDGSHHMDYFFKMPGETAEKKFDLDEWSRKGKDFLQGASSGAVIKGIIDEAVKGWDLKSSIVSLLVARLLGLEGGGDLGGTAATRAANPLFVSSPVGQNYTKILLAAEHIIDVRINDLKPRGVKVEHWLKHKPDEKDHAHDGNVDWPGLLSSARAKFQEKMGTTAAANQAEASKIAVDAISTDDDIVALSTIGVLNVNKADGKLTLDNKVKSDGNHRYQAMQDDRFNFDFNHFTAILFFEWKAVSDLRT